LVFVVGELFQEIPIPVPGMLEQLFREPHSALGKKWHVTTSVNKGCSFRFQPSIAIDTMDKEIP
jgi:hypothetical protein